MLAAACMGRVHSWCRVGVRHRCVALVLRCEPGWRHLQMARAVSGGDDVRYTVAHGLVLVLLLAVAIFVPWALISVVQDVRTQENPVYFVTDRTTAVGADYSLYLDLTRLNEGDGTITFQATAQRRCLPACSDTVQLTM